jgi:endonuclease/exonuclease/phosphatase family metal-dependent hydrolase
MVKVAIDTDTIWFISTHFGYQYEDTQIKQAELLTAVAAGLNHPAIMGGDLNAEPGSTPIHYLDNNWLATYDPNNIEFTFPADNPEKKIDFLYCYPKNKWNVLSDKVIKNNDTKEASDHLPYAATVELK